MFKPGSVNGRRGTLHIQTRELIKSIRIASNFLKQSQLEKAKEDTQSLYLGVSQHTSSVAGTHTPNVHTQI